MWRERHAGHSLGCTGDCWLWLRPQRRSGEEKASYSPCPMQNAPSLYDSGVPHSHSGLGSTILGANLGSQWEGIPDFGNALALQEGPFGFAM